MNEHLHVVVIAGGSGTRFWPLSRKACPKQLLTLGGQETLIAGTFHRVAPLVASARWWMAVGQSHAEACRVAVPEVPADQLVVEPQAKNTAPAVGLAAVHLLARDPEAIMVVLPADHHVADVAGFNAAIAAAAELAAHGPIVTLGVTPSRPDTGYGYIQRGGAEPRATGAFRVRRFCEKPDLERAKGFLAEGGYDWNAGIFVMQARTVLAEMQRQIPGVHEGLMRVAGALGTPTYAATLAAAFASMKSVSIDYGVMEGAREVCVVPVSCGWSDVGSFNALDSILGRDSDGNVVAGRAVAIDSHGCVLYAGPGQVVAAIGVHDLAVIHTADATLVVPVERAQDVRAALAKLGEKGWSEYL